MGTGKKAASMLARARPRRLSTTAADAWRALAAKEAARSGRTVESLASETPEGLRIEPCYLGPEGSSPPPPGVFPFTRGAYATMYSAKPWTIRQYAGFSSAEESNAFYRRNVAAGQQGLSVAFDLPTHRGYDSDHERAAGDVGLAGVPVDSVEDVKILFDGIDLGKMSVSMTMNGAVLPTLAMYVVAAEEAGVAPEELSGTIQNDILKEFMVRNTYIYPPAPSLRAIQDIFGFTAGRMPRFNSISVSGYHMQEAGADAALELAFTIADGLEYLNCAVEAGIDVDKVAQRLSFFFAIGMDHHVEIAKLRAARTLWAELVKERFWGAHVTSERSLLLRTHCQTSGYSLTAQEPLNNVARTALEALAAVHGGAQSLHTNAFDEAIALPTEHSARVARATQLMIQEETGVTRVADPWGGSYFMEALTSQLADKAREIIADVDAAGGMRAMVESGEAKRRVEDSAAKKQARVDAGVDVVVGVNKHVSGEPGEAVDVLRIDDQKARRVQAARIAAMKASRDDDAVKRCLERLHASALLEDVSTAAHDDPRNLVALCVDAARARATLGEISDALRSAWGEHVASGGLAVGSYVGEARRFGSEAGEAFSAAARRVEAFEALDGRRPRILVAKVGMDGHDRGANVVAAGFADLGFDVDAGPLFNLPEEVANQAVDADVHAVGVSTMAAGHNTLVPRIVEALRAKGAGHVVVVVGGVVPDCDHDHLKRHGVAAIFGPGTPLPAAAMDVLDAVEAAVLKRRAPRAESA
ncbi:methylmalonyl-CoA mutase [Aureococcus anophagefferens]|uniref:Methylmalonyl-CoA mutase n=1 Tax=Aureococcus anophagefferens TaxID=44056 RepID=A0ABR1FW87_AURAN